MLSLDPYHIDIGPNTWLILPDIFAHNDEDSNNIWDPRIGLEYVIGLLVVTSSGAVPVTSDILSMYVP